MPADEVSHRRPEGSRERSLRDEAGGRRSERAGSRPRTESVGGAGNPDRRFRRTQRLLVRRDFDRVLKTGSRRSSPELVVVTGAPGIHGRLRDPDRAVDAPRSRLGITVGRKAGNSVERNRFKRRVREWFRQHQGSLGGPVDIVVIARRPAVGLSLDELGRRLARLTRSSGGQVPGKNEEISKS